MVMSLIVRVAVRVAVLVINRLHSGGHRNARNRLRVKLPAEEKHQRRSEERKQRDQPDLVQEIHESPTTSASRFHPPARSLYCGTARSECPTPRPLPPPRRQSRRWRRPARADSPTHAKTRSG